MAGDVSGFWQYEGQPGWIEVRFEKSVSTVKVARNHEYPNRVGHTLLKGLSPIGEAGNLGQGKVYIERLGEYKNTEVLQVEPGSMRIIIEIGFITRKVDWMLVDGTP